MSDPCVHGQASIGTPKQLAADDPGLVSPRLKPQEISFPLPRSLHATAHIHLTFLETSTMVFLTSSMLGESTGSVKPMGSLVYAMPDRVSAGKSVISTTLYSAPGSVEFAARVAKILARRTGRPVYAGCSINPAEFGLMVDEEMEGVQKIIEVIMERWDRLEA